MIIYHSHFNIYVLDTTNPSTGFEGCIYRMQIDDVYPLKTAFHDPRPDFVNFVPEGTVMIYNESQF